MPMTSNSTLSYSVLGHVITVVGVETAARLPERLGELFSSDTADREWRSDSSTLFSVQREDVVWHVRDAQGLGLCQPLPDEEQVAQTLEFLAYMAAIYHADVPLMLHAGAVARGGMGVLLPNASGAGKTTLTLALASRGWLPLTDDVCPLVERNGELVATGCRRCCHLRMPSQEILRSLGVEMDGPLGGMSYFYRPRRWGEPAPVRAIVIPRYQEDVTTSFVPVTQAECMAQLAGMSFDQGARPAPERRRIAARLASRVPAFALTYSSVGEALDSFGILESQLEAVQALDTHR